ncbi:pyruvate dehydrogenase (acetyl-transferring), homodimeric type [Streptomyces alfalfae]|uniref:Pyruvate dehydrogenase E1 component n=1 Tax=Streptomyces alfalfae TaxID=1642299 RepID=A0ABN4VM36_9ACTN|nr:pyruvate dehydrogenase (acetyl-transferring), homodimeric type [Streptomyces alfalfae]AYA19088.1 pyruvate dehydrogenase (acetyl-transferring), homodimeric type [Streptomyces fradiae]APY88671.1 pyruvate dehydrogenase (acetyl-transferring), homodimeric type [Streptomyces alfalfae]QUI31391.1 pyruvate dehydrogenase (acetyl-transferring), homodimeric type [Streptomyces alfalfae]RXX35911.1 pyruvate dehydrogenase (acetyl-transferring), homodimeric type [Streptomyces alfalfae]RZM83297.1 pyruvate de
MTDPSAIQPSELDQLPDRDPEETAEWQASLDAVTQAAGPHRAAYLMRRTLERAEGAGLALPKLLETDYVNTIPTSAEPAVDGDEEMERKITAWNRWNAAAMVTRGSKHGVGGHIATFASAAWLYETGFNHFFKGKEAQDAPGSGDQLYIQGHASPGIYARAFLDGRLNETQLDNFRQEAGGNGLPSYPHPRRLPWLWEFPTVSMGLGPLSAIYQARFNRYLTNRGIKDVSASHVWAFLGDGEMDEPESTAALALAAREGLDNLTYVINCNLQRLDGPVRANFRVVQELEAQFRGAGWNVIKVLWGNAWDELFRLDTTGALVRRLREVPDAQFQTYATRDAAYIREHFFGSEPSLVELGKLLSDDKISECFHLSRGGHEARKVYAAYRAALTHKGAPTVILAQTVKGFTLGKGFASKNANHQMKKLSVDEFKDMRDLLGLPIPDSAFVDGQVPYGHPGADSPEVRYLQERRAALGGPAPARRTQPLAPLPAPADKAFASFDKGSGSQSIATTMAFVRLVKDLVRDKESGKRWVPIVPDEARTFGMESLFPSLGIYSPKGQTYEPVDRDQLMYYKEAKDGQILNEGITEAGSMADFIAASTSYATHGEVMIPFYIFYSMFGWQRTADQMWQLGDQLGRGFLVGATAGRTTLTGEGLQHADGHSPVIAATNPAALSYDPAFAYEVAAIVKDGLRRMYGEAAPGEDQNVFYYLTVYNEPMPQPAKPAGVDEGIVRGLYRFNTAESAGLSPAADAARVQLLGSGTAIHWTLAAQKMLAEEWGVAADVWSATSWTELRRDALEADEALLRGEERTPYVRQALEGAQGPVLAVSDYMRQVPDQIAQWVEQDYSSLGADGFGLSDTRDAARRHFGVDAESIVVAALAQLARRGEVPASAVKEARAKYGL